MRLLIDTVQTTSPGAAQLQEELARAAVSVRPEGAGIVFLKPPGFATIPSSPGLEVVDIPPAATSRERWRWLRTGLRREGERHRADVVYSLNGMLSRPLARSFGTLDGVNNMLPFTPELFGSYALRERLRLRLLRGLMVHSARIADAVVVPSRHGAEVLGRYAGDVSGKAFVANNPIPRFSIVDPNDPPPHRYGGAPYFFYLSVLRPYKNHLRLVEAYARAAATGAPIPDLLIAGPSEDAGYLAAILGAISAAGLEGRVKYLGLLDKDALPAWLHHATACVFPSLCETSSFVQSEILGAAGVMACSSVAPMPEVAGGAAELFDPHDPASIAQALVRLAASPERRAELRSAALARRAELTAEGCGRAIWAAAEHAFAARRRRNGGGVSAG